MLVGERPTAHPQARSPTGLQLRLQSRRWSAHKHRLAEPEEGLAEVPAVQVFERRQAIYTYLEAVVEVGHVANQPLERQAVSSHCHS